MAKRLFKWFGIGCLSTFVLILVLVQSVVGLPSITSNGLYWSSLERSTWKASNLFYSFDQQITITTLEFTYTEKVSTATAQNNPKLFKWIKRIQVDNIIVYHHDQIYNTGLGGTLHPKVQLKNDWVHIARQNNAWQIGGTFASADVPLILAPHLPDLPQDLIIQNQYSFEVTDFNEPITGTLQNIEITYPLLGKKIRLPTLDVHFQTNPQQIQLSSKRSSVIGNFDNTKTDWTINYRISLQDLVEWFDIQIPHTTVEGYWMGTLTPQETTITSVDLGFEGQIYALSRLQSGLPITYQPIHAQRTRMIGPNIPAWVPYNKLGWIAQAVIAGEDASFFTHDGFNTEGLNRAVKDIREQRNNPAGGSSITQQLAKNLFTGNRQTLDRKVEEMVYALALEHTLNKEGILTLYLNAIEFGEGIYGIKEACNQYFLKDPAHLTLKEAVFLAAILPNPREGYRRAKRGRPPTARMRVILQNLVDGQQITKVDMQIAQGEQLRLLLPVE